MKLAVISDVHGNALALTAVLHDIARSGVDLIVNLGDHLSGGLAPAETAKLLLTTPAIAVQGNHDRALLGPPAAMGWADRFAHERLGPRHLAWLRALPFAAEVVRGVVAFHGTPTSDSAFLLETITPAGLRSATVAEAEARLGGSQGRYAVYLCGHSHLQRSLRLSDGSLAINPGSAGWPAVAGTPAHPSPIEAGSPHARYAILEDGADGWAAEFRAVAYPWEDAAALARRHGFPALAHGLATGRVG
ncbi:MAG: metallophosphatase family protein [Propionibacteriaceae bacterium]|jgi:putative phosphoesterase|nr:metallophosphatase family protein [Propionibacteriaceae bacterium]